MNFLKKLLGLSLEPGDQAIVDVLANSRYRETMRVVGRGTLVIPPEEIRKSPRHQVDLDRCQRIVESGRKHP
jgi:hypothetical protein